MGSYMLKGVYFDWKDLVFVCFSVNFITIIIKIITNIITVINIFMGGSGLYGQCPFEIIFSEKDIVPKGVFLMGGAFSPNTTEMTDPDFETFVESFPLVPGRISHCSIKVDINLRNFKETFIWACSSLPFRWAPPWWFSLGATPPQPWSPNTLVLILNPWMLLQGHWAMKFQCVKANLKSENMALAHPREVGALKHVLLHLIANCIVFCLLRYVACTAWVSLSCMEYIVAIWSHYCDPVAWAE